MKLLSAGLFVLALSFAGAARADNNPLPLRTNVQSDAQDGRGETASQARAARSDVSTGDASSTRALFQGSESSRYPQLFNQAKNAATPQLKTDIQVRVGEGGDHDAKLPLAAKPSELTTSQASSPVAKPAAKLPIKSEVLVRLGELNEESAPNIQGKAVKTGASVSKAQALKNMPVKIEVLMQMQDSSGGDDSL